MSTLLIVQVNQYPQCQKCKEFPKLVFQNERCLHSFCFKCLNEGLSSNDKIKFCLNNYCTQKLDTVNMKMMFEQQQGNEKRFEYLKKQDCLKYLRGLVKLQQKQQNQRLQQKNNEQQIEYYQSDQEYEEEYEEEYDECEQQDEDAKEQDNTHNNPNDQNEEDSVDEDPFEGYNSNAFQCSICLSDHFFYFGIIKSTCKDHPYYCQSCLRQSNIQDDFENFCIFPNCQTILDKKIFNKNKKVHRKRKFKCLHCNNIIKACYCCCQIIQCNKCNQIICTLHKKNYQLCVCNCHQCKSFIRLRRTDGLMQCEQCKINYCIKCKTKVINLQNHYCMQESQMQTLNYSILTDINSNQCNQCGIEFTQSNNKTKNGKCYYCATMPNQIIKSTKLTIDEPFPEDKSNRLYQQQLNLQKEYDLRNNFKIQ